MNTSSDVVIIGGGAIGLSSAYYLVEKGISVTLIEREQPGMGCSLGNAGLISPSHFVPLAAPGLLKKGLKWMFDPEGPFWIHPRLDFELLHWLWNFYRASREHNMRQRIPVLKDLLYSSLGLFKDLGSNHDFDLAQKGLLVLHDTPEGEMDNRHESELASEVGVPTKLLNQEELRALEPGIPIHATGALYFPEDGHLFPLKFVEILRDRVLDMGGVILSETNAVRFVALNGRVSEVETTKGLVSGKEFVLAAGSWSPGFMKNLGIRLPVQAGRGFSVNVSKGKYAPKIPFICNEARLAITPMGDEIRVAGTLELSGLDLSVSERRVRAIMRNTNRYMGPLDFSGVDVAKAWSGLRPCSPDGLPYIGRFNHFSNLTAATGHAMLGISLAPITGKLVSEILSGEKPRVDISLLKPERFH